LEGEVLNAGFAGFALFVDVTLFPSDERFFVDVGVAFDVRVV
jgi:hypothetical protein